MTRRKTMAAAIVLTLLLAAGLAVVLPGAYAFAQQAATATPTATMTPGATAGTPMPGTAAQGVSGTTVAPNPNLQIAWPQPISEVNGTIDIVGTANITGMAFYRLEAIELNPDLSIPENAAWIPLTTDMTQPVDGGVLATVDTTRVPDGLYELRLSAFTGTIDTPTKESDTQVGPIRVNNDQPTSENGTPTPPAPATPAPTAAPGAVAAKLASAPYVVPAPGVTAVNVRSCAVIDNNACPVTAAIPAGGTAQITGISNSGAGWYQVVTPGGVQGWVSMSVVSVVGNASNIPIVAPPTPLPTPPPAPPTPVPPPTSAPYVPPAQGWVIPNGITIQNNTKPQCAMPFNVQVNLANTGNAQAPAGTLTVQDIHVDSGTVTNVQYGSYPALNPGQNYVVTVPMFITTYVGSKHEIRASNNYQQVSLRYTLGNGNCGAPPPTPTPQPTKTPKPPKPGNVYKYAPGECSFSIKNGTPYYNLPQGQRLGTLSQGGYGAYEGTRVNGKRWYTINIGSMVWVREQDIIKLPKSCRNV